MRRTWVVLFNLLLATLFGGLLTGCENTTVQGALPPLPRQGPSPTPTPSPTPPPTPTPTPTPFPTPTSSPTPTPTPIASRITSSRLIVGTPGFESGSVHVGVINRDGSISRAAGSPFDEGLGQPSVIQVTGDPKGRFVFVLNVEAQAAGELIGRPGLCGFAINSKTGTLSRVPGSPIVFPVRNDNNIVVDGSGHFLFEPNLSNTGFDVYSIDQTSGELTKTSASSNAPPVGKFVNAGVDGRLLFNAGKGLVEVFSIAPQTGELTAVPGTPTSTAGSAGPMAVTTDGKFLYVANQNEGTVMVFAVAASGALTPVSGSPFAVDPGPQSLRLTPDGKFLYVAAFAAVNTGNGVNATVKGYSVSPSAGTFTPIAGAVVNDANSVTLDLSGERAYVSVTPDSSGGLQLAIYDISPSSGALRKIGQATAPVSDDPFDVMTAP